MNGKFLLTLKLIILISLLLWIFLDASFAVRHELDHNSSYEPKSHEIKIESSPLKTEGGKFRILFYNVENLFDTFNEPGKNDNAFTPGGDRRWTPYRLQKKISNLYRAITAAGEWSMPAIIGLCEVENRYVLEILINNTGLRNAGYKIIHRNSPDSRGIDVAALYRPEDFLLVEKSFTCITFPFDSSATTRDILYMKGIAGINDTLHLFVNHWPSRWGGEAATAPYRNHVAIVLKSMTDSLVAINPRAKIIIMGDFNDEPEDESLKKYLGAGLDYDNPEAGKLYNISNEMKSSFYGSYKYQGVWYIYDHYIVSGSMINGMEKLQTSPQSVNIYNAGFLLIPDDTWFGFKPFRTFEGFRYTGGFSDHLPVYLDIWW
jgi:predicted extracellular nuclease